MARFADLLTHEALQVILAPGTLAHAAHPTPTSAATNVNCNAGTLTVMCPAVLCGLKNTYKTIYNAGLG